jgi:hypothetical protein
MTAAFPRIAVNLIFPIIMMTPLVTWAQEGPPPIEIINLCRNIHPEVTGDIHAGEVHRYVITVEEPKGQTIDLHLKAQSRQRFTLYAPDGSRVATQDDDPEIMLPYPGNYVLQIEPNSESRYSSVGTGHYMIMIYTRSPRTVPCRAPDTSLTPRSDNKPKSHTKATKRARRKPKRR